MKRCLALAVLLVLAAGTVLAAQGPSDPALDPLRAEVAAKPDDEAVRRKLAIALHGANLRDEAVVHFERLVEMAATPRSLLDLALAYGSVSRLEEAETTYARLLEIAPGHAIALHNLGNIAYKRGENDKAVALYEKAVAAQSDYILAYSHLGDALRQAERYADAYRTYEKVLQLEPKSAADLEIFDDALYRLASLDLQMGEYQRAGQYLAELLRANPEHPNAWYAYGQVLMRLGRAEEAAKAFETHQRVQESQKPTSPMAHGE